MLADSGRNPTGLLFMEIRASLDKERLAITGTIGTHFTMTQLNIDSAPSAFTSVQPLRFCLFSTKNEQN